MPYSFKNFMYSSFTDAVGLMLCCHFVVLLHLYLFWLKAIYILTQRQRLGMGNALHAEWHHAP
jgi:hypothetical protein